jgi:hypothetical protein
MVRYSRKANSIVRLLGRREGSTMGFHKGDKVIAAKRLSRSGWFTDVQAGEHGEVIRVNDGWWKTTYNVQFGGLFGGVTIENVDEDDLAKDRQWW